MDIQQKNMHVEKIGFKAFGTEIDIQIVVSESSFLEKARVDLLEIEKFYRATEKKFSRFSAQSEPSLLNGNFGEFLKVSAEMKEIAERALFWNKETDGYFDPRVIENLESIGYDKDFDLMVLSDSHIVPRGTRNKKNLPEDIVFKNGELCFFSRMDFSGIVKGWTTDRVANSLKEKGWENFLVDSGGDMFFAGKNIDGKSWRVDIEGIPFEKMMLELSDGAVATSGIGKRKWEKNGERFHHIINPKNPLEFSFELQSVSVVAQSTEEADVLAKVIFLMGRQQGGSFAKEKDIPCVILEYNGSAWRSPAIKRYLHSNI